MSERLLRHGASSRLNHPNLTDISQATDRPPTVLSPAPSTPLPFSPPSLSPPYCRYLLARSHPTSTNHPRILRLPACDACFPIPHSILVVVARTPREKVTSQSRVSQDPANPSWYKIAPSGSQQHRCHHRRRRSRRNAPGRVISRNWDSARRRYDIVDSGKCPWL